MDRGVDTSMHQTSVISCLSPNCKFEEFIGDCSRESFSKSDGVEKLVVTFVGSGLVGVKCSSLCQDRAGSYLHPYARPDTAMPRW